MTTNIYTAAESNDTPTIYGAPHSLTSADFTKEDKAATKLQAIFRGNKARKKTTPQIEETQSLSAEDEEFYYSSSADFPVEQESQQAVDKLYIDLLKQINPESTEELNALKNLIPQTSLSPQSKKSQIENINKRLSEINPETLPAKAQRAFSDEDTVVMKLNTLHSNVDKQVSFEPSNNLPVYPATHQWIADSKSNFDNVKSENMSLNNDTTNGTSRNRDGLLPEIKIEKKVSKSSQVNNDADKDFGISDEQDAATTKRWNQRIEKWNLWFKNQKQNLTPYIATLQLKTQALKDKVWNSKKSD